LALSRVPFLWRRIALSLESGLAKSNQGRAGYGGDGRRNRRKTSRVGCARNRYSNGGCNRGDGSRDDCSDNGGDSSRENGESNEDRYLTRSGLDSGPGNR